MSVERQNEVKLLYIYNDPYTLESELYCLDSVFMTFVVVDNCIHGQVRKLLKNKKEKTFNN